MNDETRNCAINLGLEWGENWQAPIGARILKLFPQLTQTEADKLETLSRTVQKFAFALYEEVYFGRMTRPDVEAQIKAKFSFLNEENMACLHNQGMYYAWHG